MKVDYLYSFFRIKCGDKKQIAVYLQRPDKWKFPLQPHELDKFKQKVESLIPSEINFFF